MADLFAGDGTPDHEALAALRDSQWWAEQERLGDEVAAAKGAGDPDRLSAAKAAYDQWRTYWRQVREALQPAEAPEGVARPDTVTVTTTAQEG